MSQSDRLYWFLIDNPGASSLEITRACEIVNVTGRISDLRARGFVIDCRRRSWDGRDGYWLVQKEQMELRLA
jgi:helix-turn-helix protein